LPLTIAQIRAAKADSKAIKLFDGGGLFLFVSPKGAKSWRMKYRYGGKEKLLTFGQYPDVSLADARDKRDAARALLRDHKDPAIEAERTRHKAVTAAGSTFESVALAWHADESPRWSEANAKRIMFALRRDVLPAFGKMPVSEIDPPLILRTIRAIEKRGAIETGKRVLGYISAIFKRAKAEHLVSDNPALGLVDALKPTPRGSKQPAILTVPELIAFQKIVDNARAGPLTKLASRFLALTGMRVGVVRSAAWAEFSGIDWSDPSGDATGAVWRIPAEKMKLEVQDKGDTAFDHDVPLPLQAVDVLRALHTLTGRGRLLFPGHKSARVPMSDSAISTLYKRLDGGRFKGKHVPHGWRSAFSTIMNEWAMEHGKEGDRLLIDLMLAHKPNGVSGSEFAYMRAKFTARRRVLAEVWAGMITDGLPPPMTIMRHQPDTPSDQL